MKSLWPKILAWLKETFQAVPLSPSLVALSLVSLAGCISPGKPLVLGPVSWVTGNIISENQGHRRAAVLRATQLGSGESAAPAVGVDLLALDKAAGMTWKEWVTQITAVATELYAYYKIVEDAYDRIKDEPEPGKASEVTIKDPGEVRVNIDGGAVTIVWGP